MPPRVALTATELIMRNSPLHEEDELGPLLMLLLWWVLKYVDVARHDSAERRATDLAQQSGPEGRQGLVLNGNGHPLAPGLGSVRSVGQAGQIGKFAANGPSNAPSIRRATHEQPPILPRLRKGNEDIVTQV